MAAVANACLFVFWTKLAAKSLRFFSDKPEGDEGGFSANLRDALLAFRKKYPETHFIDVEFKGSD
jgi:hypothetical protein